MTPTFIDDIALSLERLFQVSENGIYHVVGSQFLSPYEAALAIAKTFAYDTSLIKQTTRETFFQGRAPRPFRLALKNDKIRKLGLEMATFDQGLLLLKKQL
jgi:dTDP-4-dehydrorhamnose reductase